MIDIHTNKDADDDMCDWRNKIAQRLCEKRRKLNEQGFRILAYNWLLIYDEPGLGNDEFDYASACRHLAELPTRSTYQRDYDSIFILSRRYLFRLQKGKWISAIDRQMFVSPVVSPGHRK